MRQFLKYLRFIRQKPSIIPRGIRGMFIANVLKRPVLRGAELAVTYRCQAKCSKCSIQTLTEEKRREMSLNEIIAISRQIVQAGGILIDLTGGEPLLRSDIVQIVEQLGKLPVIVSMATNGVLLNDVLLDDLKKARLNVLQVGLNSPVPEEHDAETGISGSFAAVLSGIKKARRRGIEVLINTVATRDILYSGKIERIAALAKNVGGYLSLIMPAAVGGWTDKKDVQLIQNDAGQIKNLLKNPFVTTDMESCYRKGKCPAGTEKIYISAYGDIYPCPFIQNKYGCLLTDNFSELWQKMQMQSCYGQCVNLRCGE